MPTTTTGKASEFITFSRTSNATLTDSDGKIKWAPHNLLLASEQFDAASWTKTNTTSATPVITANAGVAPNGTTTADRVDYGLIDAAGDNSVVYQTFTALDATYTASVYVKAFASGDVGKKVWIYCYDTAYRGVASVTLSASWQLLTTNVTLTAGSNREFYISTLGSTNGGENQGAVSVLLWGASLTRSDLGGMKANTSAYPMYNPTTPKNLLGYTEDYSGTGWARSNVTVSGPVVAPNGLSTADTITSTSSVATTVGIYNAINFGVGSTISIYAKAGTSNIAWVSSDTAQSYAIFNLATEAVIASANGTPSITPVGGGWYRIAVSNVTVAGTYFIAGGKDSYTSGGPWGNGTWTSGNTVYLWGAQLSDSASLDTYVPNYGAAPTAAAYYGPRLDCDGSTLAAKGLLVEESRANLVLNSAAFGSWSDNGATVTANTVVAPDGTTTADELTRASATSDSRFQTVTFTGDGTKSVSIYVKYNTAPTFAVFLYDSTAVANRMLIDFAFTAGVPASSTVNSGSVEAIENVGGGWYRIKVLCPSVVAANTNVLYVYPARTGSANGQKTTFWGAQAENGSFATSYIPTGAATATRNADVASVSTSQFPYSATEGTVVVAYDMIASRTALGYPSVVQCDNGTGSAYIAIRQDGTSDYRRYGVVVNGASTVAMLNLTAETLTANTVLKAGLAFKENDFAFARGSTLGTASTGTIPIVNTMRLGQNEANIFVNSHIRQITYIPRRLTNAELQTRTA